MTIYTKTRTKVNYRRIYEQHYGPIPKEPNGRSYEIHHIDGNDNNNDPINLIAVSLQEHYDIHYSQGDWGACFKLGGKLKLSPQEISNISRKTQSKRLAEGSHNFQTRPDGTNLQTDKLAAGTHPFSGDTHPAKLAAKNGTHHMFDSAISTAHAQARIDKGNHPTQKSKTCPHCGITCNTLNYGKSHGDNCSKIKGKRVMPKTPCPHCNNLYAANILAQHHGDKCRKKAQALHLGDS
jgi:hypothetical protein